MWVQKNKDSLQLCKDKICCHSEKSISLKFFHISRAKLLIQGLHYIQSMIIYHMITSSAGPTKIKIIVYEPCLD